MSSALRRFAQIPPRIGYFLALEASVDSEDITECSALALKAGVTLASLNTFVLDTEVSTYLTSSSYSDAALLKDLGQEIIIVDTAGRHVARYRNALVMNGPLSEGINTAQGPNVLVRVWAAAGNNVTVARTG